MAYLNGAPPLEPTFVAVPRGGPQLKGGQFGLRKQPVVHYGVRLATALSGAAGTPGMRRLLPVVTPALLGDSHVSDALVALGSVAAPVFSEVRPHTPFDAVLSLITRIERLAPDALLAIGGGSTIDAAKIASLALAAGARDQDALLALSSVPDSRGDLTIAPVPPSLPVIAVPTTLSSAEHGMIGGATHAGIKHLFKSYDLPPNTIIYDPWLATGTPLTLWLATGIRSLDHGIETFLSRDSNPFTDALAMRGLALLREGLPTAYRRPDDACARHTCQMGAWLSGCSIGRVRYGASHGIAHQLGAITGVPHGLTSCVLLPAVLAYNESVSADKQALIAAALNCHGARAADAVRDLIRSLGLPTRISELGVGREMMPRVAESALNNAFVRANPRPIKSPSDILEILNMAY